MQSLLTQSLLKELSMTGSYLSGENQSASTYRCCGCQQTFTKPAAETLMGSNFHSKDCSISRWIAKKDKNTGLALKKQRRADKSQIIQRRST